MSGRPQNYLIIDNICYTATKFAENVDEYQERIYTFYRLVTFHKWAFKAQYIANNRDARLPNYLNC